MLNEEKIILMTQMASYEENEGKKNMAIGRYFRSDSSSPLSYRSIDPSHAAHITLPPFDIFLTH